jgi:hypothetical protein
MIEATDHDLVNSLAQELAAVIRAEIGALEGN